MTIVITLDRGGLVVLQMRPGRPELPRDSSICAAAVHAGVIAAETGGDVNVEMQPGARAYRGAIPNGVTLASRAHAILGFVVVR